MMPETKNMTIRLPREVYEQLRTEAFEKRSPIATVILDAIRTRHAPSLGRQPCDECGKPSTRTTTPGGFRFCDDCPQPRVRNIASSVRHPLPAPTQEGGQ